MAEPKPVVTLTLMPPIILHTMMYHSMLFLPYLHAPEARRPSRKHAWRSEKDARVETHRGAK